MLPAPSRGVWSHPQSFLLPAVSRRCATVWIFALLRAFDVRFKHQLQIPKKPRICSWNLYWKIVAWKAKFSNCGKQKISSWSHQFQILYGPTGGSTGDVFSWRFNMASLRICKSCSERLRHWAWLLHPFLLSFFFVARWSSASNGEIRLPHPYHTCMAGLPTFCGFLW